jgi:hypothetical protein
MGVERFDEGWVVWAYRHIRHGRSQMLPKLWVPDCGSVLETVLPCAYPLHFLGSRA